MEALRHGVVADQRDALAKLLQRLADGRQRADGVAVRIHVGNDQHAVGFLDGELDHRLPLSACAGLLFLVYLRGVALVALVGLDFVEFVQFNDA